MLCCRRYAGCVSLGAHSDANVLGKITSSPTYTIYSSTQFNFPFFFNYILVQMNTPMRIYSYASLMYCARIVARVYIRWIGVCDTDEGQEAARQTHCAQSDLFHTGSASSAESARAYNILVSYSYTTQHSLYIPRASEVHINPISIAIQLLYLYRVMVLL